MSFRAIGAPRAFAQPLPRGYGTVGDAYGVGMLILVRVVPTFVNRLVRSFPRTWAPAAIARATKTISIAYSVAVAPPSSVQMRLSRASIWKILLQRVLAPWPVGAKGDHNSHPAGDLITEFQSGRRTSQRQKIAFSKIFIGLWG